MFDVKTVQMIGNEICGDCGPNRDCDTEISECPRISMALTILDEYVREKLLLLIH